MNNYKKVSLTVVVGLVVWAASLVLYVSTLAPTLTWGVGNIGVDGGELLAAAETLGIAHPPGYPTYTLLLKTFATLVPIGDFAYRGNLLSAVLASVSVALLYALALRVATMTTPRGRKNFRIAGAAIGAVAFATAPLLWSQATITEVYTLNAAFVLALVYVAAGIVNRPGDAKRSNRNLAVFGLLLGLGLGNHLSLAIVAIPLIAWLWHSLGWRRMATAWPLVAFAIGISIYAYVPIRAAANPPVNWGYASDLNGLMWILTGKVYQGYFGVPLVLLPGLILTWAELLFSQFNPLGMFFGIIGAKQLYSQRRSLFVVSLAIFGAISVYSVAFNSIDSQVLLVPALIIFSLWIGYGFMRAIEFATSRATSRAERRRDVQFGSTKLVGSYAVALLLVVGLGALPTASVLTNYGDQDLSDNDVARTYAANIIDSVPEDSLVFSSLEGRVFSLWYYRFVEAKDSNVIPIAVPLLQFDWYWRSIHETYPDRIPEQAPGDNLEGVRRIVEHNNNSNRMYFTYRDAFLQDTFDLEPSGNLFEAHLKGDEVSLLHSSPVLVQPVP